MRSRSLLLCAAGVLSVVHVVGVLTNEPILRQAEVAALLLLLAYALLAGRLSPRWALPAALAVLVVGASRTMPADPADGRRWQMFWSTAPPDVTVGLRTGLQPTWAALVAVLLLLLMVARWPGRRPSRPILVGLALVAVTVTGYAVLGLVEVRRAASDVAAWRPDDHGWQSDSTLVAAVAILPPLALVLGVLVLAAMLIARGRRLAAGGAGLLAVAALLHLDVALAAHTSLPYSASRGVLFTDAFVVTGSTDAFTLATVPALTIVAELAGYLLLVVGLSGGGPARTRPAGEAAAPAGG